MGGFKTSVYPGIRRVSEYYPSLSIPCKYQGKFAEVLIDDNVGKVRICVDTDSPFPTGEKPRLEEELLVDCGEGRWEYREGPNLEYTTELVYVPASLSKMPVERFVETEQYKRTAESNWKERG